MPLTESSFLTTHKILSEPSNSFDLLRIIAQDEKRLAPHDRDVLRDAADELEAVLKILIINNAKLIEAQQQMIALNDQLIAERSKQSNLQHWSYGSGWLSVRGYRT